MNNLSRLALGRRFPGLHRCSRRPLRRNRPIQFSKARSTGTATRAERPPSPTRTATSTAPRRQAEPRLQRRRNGVRAHADGRPRHLDRNGDLRFQGRQRWRRPDRRTFDERERRAVRDHRERRRHERRHRLQAFAAKTAGGNWRESVLYSFCAATGCADGAHPVAGLTLGKERRALRHDPVRRHRRLRSVRRNGFSKVTPPSTKGRRWTETGLLNFCDLFNCADGFEPNEGRLLRTGNGVLYGATTKSDSAGVVYALTPSGRQLCSNRGARFQPANRRPCAACRRGRRQGRPSLRHDAIRRRQWLRHGLPIERIRPPEPLFLLSECRPFRRRDSLRRRHPDARPVTACRVRSTGPRSPAMRAPMAGVVFKLTPGATGHPWNETVLYSFCSQTDCTDGANPRFGTAPGVEQRVLRNDAGKAEAIPGRHGLQGDTNKAPAAALTSPYSLRFVRACPAPQASSVIGGSPGCRRTWRSRPA